MNVATFSNLIVASEELCISLLNQNRPHFSLLGFIGKKLSEHSLVKLSEYSVIDVDRLPLSVLEEAKSVGTVLTELSGLGVEDFANQPRSLMCEDTHC